MKIRAFPFFTKLNNITGDFGAYKHNVDKLNMHNSMHMQQKVHLSKPGYYSPILDKKHWGPLNCYLQGSS